MHTCPVCYNPLSDEDAVCNVCGLNFVGSQASDPASERHCSVPKHKKETPLDEALAKLPFRVTEKIIKRIGITLAAVFLFSCVLSFFKPAADPSYLLYAKNEEIFFTKADKLSPKQVTFDYGKTVFDYDIGRYYRLSNDGKRIFFFDYGSNNLYYRSSKLNKEAVFLASNVNSYDISDSGELLTYIKDGNLLYQHNLKKQLNLIDDGVVAFYASGDGKSVVYTKYEDEIYSLYRYRFGKTPEQVASEVSNICYLSEDFTTVFYTKQGYLFRDQIGGKSLKIASDVYNVIKVYDNGKAYFVTVDAESGRSDLCYFDGKKSRIICENYGGFTDFSDKRPAIVFCTPVDDDLIYFVSVEDKVFKIDKKVYDTVHIDPSGSNIYLIADASTEDRKGDLYKASISKNGIKRYKLVDEQVYEGKYVDTDKFVYVKNYDVSRYSGDIYLNGKLIGEGLAWSETSYIEMTESFVAFRNLNGIMGDMCYYRNGKLKEVAKNVLITNFCITASGDVLYLAEYSELHSLGELYIFNGSRSKSVDVGVSFVTDAYSSEEIRELLKKSIV